MTRTRRSIAATPPAPRPCCARRSSPGPAPARPSWPRPTSPERAYSAAMTDSARLSQPVSARDHVRGPETASVTLVEYGDFQCPHCGAAYPVVAELQRRFADRLRFVFRHFPLTNVHPHAQAAAEVSEWAAAQGRFWEMHDRIYEQQ